MVVEPEPRVALGGYAAALTLGYVMGRFQRPAAGNPSRARTRYERPIGGGQPPRPSLRLRDVPPNREAVEQQEVRIDFVHATDTELAPLQSENGDCPGPGDPNGG